MNVPYDLQTVDSPNPIARYAHRNRIKNSVKLALSRLASGRVLDYGCGSGVFIGALNSLRPECAVGYEPYMADRRSEALPIYSRLDDVESQGPFSLVTLFETIEHLSDHEAGHFLQTCDKVLTPGGGILLSGPIEIGPALIAKEFNRSIRHLQASEYGLAEFFKACLLGVPGRRARNIKTSHKGFDFRRAVEFIKGAGWHVDVLQFGPLPIGTWYGNSQVYLWLTRSPLPA